MFASVSGAGSAAPVLLFFSSFSIFFPALAVPFSPSAAAAAGWGAVRVAACAGGVGRGGGRSGEPEAASAGVATAGGGCCSAGGRAAAAASSGGAEDASAGCAVGSEEVREREERHAERLDRIREREGRQRREEEGECSKVGGTEGEDCGDAPRRRSEHNTHHLLQEISTTRIECHWRSVGQPSECLFSLCTWECRREGERGVCAAREVWCGAGWGAVLEGEERKR